MPKGKPTTDAAEMPQARATHSERATTAGAGKAGSLVPGRDDRGTARPSAGSPPGDAHAQPRHDRGNGPDAEPAAATGSRFKKLPAWALLPREVAIGLGAVIAAGVVILLVLGWQ